MILGGKSQELERNWGGVGGSLLCFRKFPEEGLVCKSTFQLSRFCFSDLNIYFKISNDMKGRCKINCQPVLTICIVCAGI